MWLTDVHLHMPGYRFGALVADNDARSRERAVSALGSVGFRCHTADDGQHALGLMTERRFDLLLTDLVLPKLHGHSLVVEAQRLAQSPRIVVWTEVCIARLVRDLLSRGIADYLHKSVPLELLATKMLALFDIDQSRRGQAVGKIDEAQLDRESLLAIIEKRMQALTVHYVDRLAPLFDTDQYVADPPSAVVEYASRLSRYGAGGADDVLGTAGELRGSRRVDLLARARVVATDENYQATDVPVGIIMCDVSTSGARFLHTRALESTIFVLEWEAETMPFSVFRVPLRVTRCRPEARFYHIAGAFEVPAGVLDR